MNIQFNDETFYDDFTFRNSEWAIRRFPFPFHEDSYIYSVNLEPPLSLRPGSVFEKTFDVDEYYVSEMRGRARVLADDPLRCQSLPHMTLADWDLLELIMEAKAPEYPDLFELHREGDRWHWINKPLGIDQTFTFLDGTTLPCGPMEYITRQAQGDFALLDQRGDNLWMDAGMVTTQADWSLDFDIGMNFYEWHAPVPKAHEMGVFQRALKFLLNLQQGVPVRRLNRTMTVNPLLDTGPENYHRRGGAEDQRHAGERRQQVSPAGGVADAVPPAALHRAGFPDPLLPDPVGGSGDGAEMGPPPLPSASVSCK